LRCGCTPFRLIAGGVLVASLKLMRSGGRHGRSTCPQSTARVPRSTEDSTSRGVGGIFDRGLQLLYNCSRTSLTSRTAAERHLAIFLIRSDESDTCDESRNRMTRVSDESATPGRDSSDRRVAAARRQSRGDSSDERNEHCVGQVSRSRGATVRPARRVDSSYTRPKIATLARASEAATSRTNIQL
jgi:hypothetical protein